MSKKYILVVKEEYHQSNYFPKPIGKHQIIITCRYYNNKVNIISDEPSTLTQEEINELPYGFVTMFNIVEVEDTKYYWRKRQEYLCGFENHLEWFLNYDSIDERKFISVNQKELFDIKTKFTEAEVLNLVGTVDFKMFERVDI